MSWGPQPKAAGQREPQQPDAEGFYVGKVHPERVQAALVAAGMLGEACQQLQTALADQNAGMQEMAEKVLILLAANPDAILEELVVTRRHDLIESASHVLDEVVPAEVAGANVNPNCIKQIFRARIGEDQS